MAAPDASTNSYSPNYFSLEDILATQERVPVETLDDLAGLGHLDPGADNKDLARGTKSDSRLGFL
jgi:hypothetical protein